MMCSPSGARIRQAVLVVAILVGNGSALHAQSEWPPALDSVLSNLGLTTHTARFDRDAVAQWGGDRYANPRFRRVHHDPWALPQTITREAEAVVKAGSSLFELLRLATLRTGEGVYRGLIGDPIARYSARADSADTPLLDALPPLYELVENRFMESQAGSLAREADKLSGEMRSLLACWVWAYSDWLEWRRLALRKVSKGNTGLHKILPLRDPGLGGIFRSQTEHDTDEMDALEFVQWYDFLERVDLSYLYTGALDLAAVTEWVADSASRLTEITRSDFVWDTPVGRIAINGAGDHEYGAGKKYLFILDVGGADVYHSGATSVNITYHSGVIIDLAGNDTYQTDKKLAVGIGGGLLGVGLVIDLQGDDHYDAGSRSLGCGVFGVGGVIDHSGDDEYRGYVASQGAGLFGVGVLADLAGDDTYFGAQQIQGYGYVRGCGILYDAAGRDRYEADDERLDFASSQSPDHNASLAQGVGFGLRADYEHGHSLAGGLGYLVDGGGDDTYSAGLFAQGCAYWYAFGMLADLGGTDTYDGIWYVQGSGAHFGVGTLYDRDGDDVYRATMNMAQGAGHDFTTGLLWDAAGNDLYEAPSLSLGAGNANGIGIFRDDGGDDTYVVTEATTLGRSNTPRAASLRWDLMTLGLFLDLGGEDSYPAAKGFARNDATWTQDPPQDEFSPVALGAGIDTEVPE